MKKIFYLLAVVGVVLTGCKDNNSPENGFGAFTFTEDVSKPIEFDGSSNERSLIFAAQADWSASIQQGASKVQAKKSPQKAAENSPTWITVSPKSGQKGTQQITITCSPNDQNEERSATITISDGKNELKITVLQEALSGDFDVFSAMDDFKFKKYCEQFDTDKDGKLSLTEAKVVKELYCQYYRSVKGIEYFTNLEKLSIKDCYVLSLDLSNNKKLESLRVYDNDYLTSLDVSNHTALTELHYDTDVRASLNVSGCTALTELECGDNQLTSLDVSGCTALEELRCFSTQLTSLDVSSCTALEELQCFSNQLTSLDVSKNTALHMLVCNSNQLTKLDVSKNTALTCLYCSSNQLTELDVSKNTALQEFRCSSNQLTELDVSKNTALTWLYCDNNPLKSLDVSKNTALFWLECSSNQLKSLDVSKNTALQLLYCDNNQLTLLDVSNNTALKYLQCYNNQLTSLDVSNNTAMFSPEINVIAGLTLLPMSTLKTLYLKTGASYRFYENKFGNELSIDDIKNKGIEVIYK